MAKIDFGVGLMHEYAITAAKAGWEPQDIANLSQDENLMKLVRGVLRGTHEIKNVAHIIDCDAEPFIPGGWKVENHQKGGIIQFDATKIDFYLSKKQEKGSIQGNALREELKDKKVLNANVLDYLLVNPRAIPEEWKGKYIFFWGTIYRDSGGGLYVRCLCWHDGAWRWSHNWLDSGFRGSSPAALSLQVSILELDM